MAQYTVNGKRVEVAVKKVINGAKPSSVNTRYVFAVVLVIDEVDIIADEPSFLVVCSTQRHWTSS